MAKKTKTKAKPSLPREIIKDKHLFSEAEIGDVARRAAQEHNRVSELEDQAKATAADYKAKIQRSKATIDELNNQITSGYTMRDVEATVEYAPKKKIKIYRNAASGKLIREEPMTDGDFEMQLPLADPTPAPFNPVVIDESERVPDPDPAA